MRGERSLNDVLLNQHAHKAQKLGKVPVQALDYDMVREVGRNIRVHGNGFIQIDVFEDQRVHVFGHPDAPRQNVPTPIHDHRWGLTSHVLTGTLVNVVWTFHVDDMQPHTHFICGYTPTRACGEDTKLIPSERTGYLQQWGHQVVMAGQLYTHPRGILHETFANEPTVTVMTKKDVPGPNEEVPDPRVLCRIGQYPDNGFDRETFNQDDLWRMVREAFMWKQ